MFDSVPEPNSKHKRDMTFILCRQKMLARLDVIEFHWVCQALGQDAASVYKNLIKAIEEPTGRPPGFNPKRAKA
jgi:hypothetical protein